MERLLNVHPGEVLQEDFLIPLGISAYRLSKEIGVTQIQISQIIRGNRSITPAMALRFAAYFGTTAKFWLNLQALYDLEEEREKLKETLAGIRPVSEALIAA
jgi:antitoxin HigA-1